MHYKKKYLLSLLVIYLFTVGILQSQSVFALAEDEYLQLNLNVSMDNTVYFTVTNPELPANYTGVPQYVTIESWHTYSRDSKGNSGNWAIEIRSNRPNLVDASGNTIALNKLEWSLYPTTGFIPITTSWQFVANHKGKENIHSSDRVYYRLVTDGTENGGTFSSQIEFYIRWEKRPNGY